MDQRQPVYTETAACQDCYKCVRECPVKAIRVSSGHASVVGELCVLCGHCVEVCPVGAKKVRSDVERAKALIELKPRVLLSLAPSFAAEFPGVAPERLVAALRRLGFAAVSETAFGADLVSRATAAELEALRGPSAWDLDAAQPDAAQPDAAVLAAARRPRVLLSTACPVVVDYVLKYRPALAGLLSASCSPMLAHARHLKAVSGPGTAVVFAGPCIAKKREADGSMEGPGALGGVEAAVTFRGLRTWLQEEGLDPAALEAGPEDRFYPERASKGVLYPVDGGMISSVKRHVRDRDVHFVSYSGLVEIEKALDGLEDYEGEEPIFLELLACEGGCVNGPRCERRSGTVAKRLRVLDYARGAREEAPETGVDLADARPGRSAVPAESYPEERLREALRLVGKHEAGDELNCSGCGYDSCRAFAAALLSGRAERTMCVSYMRDLAQKKADALVRAMPSGVVVADAELRVVECNEKFASLLGPDAATAFEARPGLSGAELERLVPFAELFSRVMSDEGPEYLERDLKIGDRVLHGTVFSIERGAYSGGVFQDVTLPWIQRDRIVAQAKAVIDKNLRTVQRIAYLLGENAADTESTLESIIESFSAASGKAKDREEAR